MSHSLKAQIEILVKLQSIESEQFQLEKSIKSVPGKISELDAQLASHRRELETANEEVAAVKKAYREYDAAVKENLEKAKKSDNRLVEVKNNKEYQSILKEIEDLKQKNSLLEDRMLEALDFLDQEEGRLKDQEAAFETAKKEIEADRADLLEESRIKKEQIAALEADKKNVLATVDRQMMDQYEKVKKVVGRIAMARVENAMCHACNMNIPPQRFNELMRCEDVLFCPHCHRMMYWEEKNTESTE